MSRQALPTGSEVPYALRADARSRMIKSVQDLVLALPNDERGMWSRVVITPYRKGPLTKLRPCTINQIRRDLHACLNESPIRTIPFIGVITLLPWKNRGLILPDTMSSWTYKVYGLTRIDSRDRRMKSIFKLFMQQRPHYNVVRFYPANSDERDPSFDAPADLIEPTLEKLQLSRQGRDPALWAELKAALPSVTLGDFILERGTPWFPDLLGVPASDRRTLRSLENTTRRLRQTTPFVVQPKGIDWELFMQCGLVPGSSQTH